MRKEEREKGRNRRGGDLSTASSGAQEPFFNRESSLNIKFYQVISLLCCM